MQWLGELLERYSQLLSMCGVVLQLNFVAAVWRKVSAPIDTDCLQLKLVPVNSNDYVVIGA